MGPRPFFPLVWGQKGPKCTKITLSESLGEQLLSAVSSLLSFFSVPFWVCGLVVKAFVCPLIIPGRRVNLSLSACACHGAVPYNAGACALAATKTHKLGRVVGGGEEGRSKFSRSFNPNLCCFFTPSWRSLKETHNGHTALCLHGMSSKARCRTCFTCNALCSAHLLSLSCWPKDPFPLLPPSIKRLRLTSNAISHKPPTP